MSSHADTGGGFIVHGGGWIMRADLSDGEPALAKPLLPKDWIGMPWRNFFRLVGLYY